MGILDKAKAQAQEIKAQAQEIKGKVEGKVEDAQQKHKASDLLEALGRLAYAEATDREASASERDRLVGELRALEADGVAVLAAPEVAS